MERLLIIGKLNHTNQGFDTFFRQSFESHLCSEDVPNMDKVLTLVGPSVILFSLAGNMGEFDANIYRSVVRVCPKVPVVSYGSEFERRNYMYFYGSPQFEHLDKNTPKEEIVKVLLRKADEYRKLMEIENAEENLDVDDLDAELAALEGLDSLDEMINGTGAGAGAAAGPKVEERDPNAKARVLVIDDDPMMLRSIKGLLDSHYEVTIANSGMKGITAIAKKRPDVILLDYEMPVCDGKQTLEMIRSDEETADIPVIFLTGLGDMEHIKSVLALKPAAYILKPADSEALISKIESCLK